jgi:hypothetical protein
VSRLVIGERGLCLRCLITKLVMCASREKLVKPPGGCGPVRGFLVCLRFSCHALVKGGETGREVVILDADAPDETTELGLSAFNVFGSRAMAALRLSRSRLFGGYALGLRSGVDPRSVMCALFEVSGSASLSDVAAGQDVVDDGS